MPKRVFIRMTLISLLLASTGVSVLASSATTEQKNKVPLNGGIGPYDPSDPNQSMPDFSVIQDPKDSNQIEGQLPDRYYTIAVTAPTNMKFAINGKSNKFTSPVYRVSNNATRPVHISVVDLEDDLTPYLPDDSYTKLHLREPDSSNTDSEIQLFLGMTNTTSSVMKRVLLSENFNINDPNENHYLGVLDYQQSGDLQLNSTWWDSDGAMKDSKNDFKIVLQFSLDDPSVNLPTP